MWNVKAKKLHSIFGFITVHCSKTDSGSIFIFKDFCSCINCEKLENKSSHKISFFFQGLHE